MLTDPLDGGFADAPIEAARTFRAAMTAMARPGTITTVPDLAPPAPLSAAAAALILTLCDADAPIHLAGRFDTPDIRAWIAFHTSAPMAGREAPFALGDWAGLSPLTGYGLGTAEFPDRSTSLIVEVATLSTDGPRLTGPGIRDAATLSLPETEAFRANRALFPRGLDFWFTCGDRLAALPRTTIVEDV